jgi:hypothetical protein
VNPTIGEQPRIGPFSPSIFIVLVISLFFSYLVKQLLNLDWISMSFLTLWIVATWWLLTGKRPWRFYQKLFFHTPPSWIRAGGGFYAIKGTNNGSRQEKNT